MARFFRKICCLAVFVLTAFVSADAYTISYNLNGGVNHPDNPTSYEDNLSKLTFYEPTREGHVFKGWYFEKCDAVVKSVVMNSTRKCDETFKYMNISVMQKDWLGGNYGNFTLFAMWEPVPKTPSQDERGCYLIHNAEELYGILSVSKNFQLEDHANLLEDLSNLFDSHYIVWVDYFFDGCISLQNDIVVNRNLLDKDGNVASDSLVWWPLFGFSGTFEGNGYKISGLRAENGLFTVVGGSKNYAGKKTSVVSNLGIVDSYFSSTFAGGIVGIAYSPAKLMNVYSNATVYGNEYGGGIVGRVNLREGIQSAALADSIKRNFSFDDYSNLVVVENAYSLGHIESGDYVGGIAGDLNKALVRNVYFAGTLDGPARNCISYYRYDRISTPFDEDVKVFDSYAKVENGYCVETDSLYVPYDFRVTQAEFADGTVFGRLSKGVNGGSWAQEIGKDAYPVLKVGKSSIRYVLNGGVNSDKNPSSFEIGGAAIVLQEPQKENDVFEGWFLDSLFTQKVEVINTDNYGEWTLYAKWKGSFLVTRVLNAAGSDIDLKGKRYLGSLSDSVVTTWSAEFGKFVLETASREGYDFEGWFTDAQFANKITEIPAGNTEDVTVYAKWKPIVYKITYHMNGGTNHPDNPGTFTIEDLPVKLKVPTREGLRFYEWLPRPFGGMPIDSIGQIGDVDAYAGWMPMSKEPAMNDDSCYKITNKEELYWFSDYVNEADSIAGRSEVCASLENDIVVNEHLLKDTVPDATREDYLFWYPIASRLRGDSFHGNIYGNGHSISGLLWSNFCSGLNQCAGVVCRLGYYAVVQDVVVKDSYDGLFNMAYANRNVTVERLMRLVEKSKSGLRVSVNGNRVSLSGLVAGRPLFVMDVQGRVLRRLTTESSMVVEMPKSGRFFIRYGSETRAVTIR